MKINKTILKIISPFLILIAGVIIFKIMVAHKQPPAQKITVQKGALVKVMAVTKVDKQVDVQVTGTIVPKQEISIIPQVSGKLVYVAPSFEAGSYFSAGELLLKIEDVDYNLAIERTQAQVAKMEFDLTSVQSKAQVARAEWRRLHPNGKKPINSLVLYGPQIKDAKANMASAMAALQQAKINLSRTRITAPFNCRVRSEHIAIGQYVAPGNKIAVLVGSDIAEAIVPVPLTDLAWLKIPRSGKMARGSKAAVEIQSGGRTFSWSGRLARSLGEVDQVGKMVRLAVTVPDPYNLHDTASEDRPELALGMFVRVIFKGRIAAGVFSLPRRALRENDTLWLMNTANKLKVVHVDIIRRQYEDILVRKGLRVGDRVILTKLVGAVDGMSLRLMSSKEN